MKLADKIIGLRKSNGMSQEGLAEKLDVSRQAVSRWESGTAMPDADNLLQLSRLFRVTTDYLLNEDDRGEQALPEMKKTQKDDLGPVVVCLVSLEAAALLMQFVTTVILQNTFWGFLSFLPFVAAIGGFEYAWQKNVSGAAEKAGIFRKKFYKISAWLGLYFPIRYLVRFAMRFYPRPFSALLLESAILALYIGAAAWVGHLIGGTRSTKEQKNGSSR